MSCGQQQTVHMFSREKGHQISFFHLLNEFFVFHYILAYIILHTNHSTYLVLSRESPSLGSNAKVLQLNVQNRKFHTTWQKWFLCTWPHPVAQQICKLKVTIRSGLVHAQQVKTTMLLTPSYLGANSPPAKTCYNPHYKDKNSDRFIRYKIFNNHYLHSGYHLETQPIRKIFQDI